MKKDLSAAKDGLRRAIAAELGDDDIVYYALWVHLLEKQLKKGKDTRQDGSVARICTYSRCFRPARSST